MVVKKFKLLMLALIFSGALNVGLIAAFAFFMFQGAPASPVIYSVKKQQETTTNGQLLASMSRLSFRELVSFLTNRDLVEEGYTKRDLAIAALVAFHSFNIEKALSGSSLQVRALPLPSGQKIDLFPGLSEDQFEAIIRFAYQEKWPLTAKGLFSLLQAQNSPREESLEQALLVTPEFDSLRLLFQKTGVPQETATLLNLACEGNWELLEKLAREQSQVLDFSVEKRRDLILSYLSFHSSTAAQLLLRTDFAFALKKLDDRKILDLLALLKKQTEEGTQFCIEILRSPRSDAIWQAAAMTLYAYVGEIPTVPLDPKAILARFAPKTPNGSLPDPVVLPVPARFHVVKEKENLWKISRMYGVKVNELIQLNALEKDSLYPGMTLKLPQGTGSEPPR